MRGWGQKCARCGVWGAGYSTFFSDFSGLISENFLLPKIPKQSPQPITHTLMSNNLKLCNTVH